MFNWLKCKVKSFAQKFRSKTYRAKVPSRKSRPAGLTNGEVLAARVLHDKLKLGLVTDVNKLLTGPQQRYSNKHPRNASCSCGGSKKYKHCCGKVEP